MKGLKIIAVAIALISNPVLANEDSMDGMFYCTETASVGITEGKGKTFSNDKLTIKIKDRVVSVKSDSAFNNTFNHESNNINHENGWVYVKQAPYNFLTLRRVENGNFEFVIAMRLFSKKNEKRVDHQYLSEGNCEKW